MPTLTLQPFTRAGDDGETRHLWRCRVEAGGEAKVIESRLLRNALEPGVHYLRAFEEERRAEEREGTDAGTESPAEREGVAQGEDAAPPPGEAAPDGPALKLLGNDDAGPELGREGGNGQPAPDVTGTPGREPDLRERKARVEAGAARLDLKTHQAAAVVQQALDLSLLTEQTLAHQKKGTRELVTGVLVVAAHQMLFDGRPFWYAVTQVRHENDKGARIGHPGHPGGGPAGKLTKRRAWCHALAAALMQGVGQYQDTLWLAEDARVLHVARALHDDELRHLEGVLPDVDTDGDPVDGASTWTRPATSYRSAIKLAGEHEMPPERRK